MKQKYFWNPLVAGLGSLVVVVVGGGVGIPLLVYLYDFLVLSLILLLIFSVVLSFIFFFWLVFFLIPLTLSKGQMLFNVYWRESFLAEIVAVGLNLFPYAGFGRKRLHLNGFKSLGGVENWLKTPSNPQHFENTNTSCNPRLNWVNWSVGFCWGVSSSEQMSKRFPAFALAPRAEIEVGKHVLTSPNPTLRSLRSLPLLQRRGRGGDQQTYKCRYRGRRIWNVD